MKSGLNNDSFSARLDPKTIEVVWGDHRANCARCAFVVLDQSVTLVNSCPEGAQYLKVLFEKRREPELAEKKKAEARAVKGARGEFYASKKKVKAAMRFK